MKMIVAYIQTFMKDKATDALRISDVHGVTAVPCEGFGRKINGKEPRYEDTSIFLGYAPKCKIEIVCKDEDVESIVQTISKAAHTGRHGDGKIFVMDVMQAFDIRTGKKDEIIL
jgi:nitrogen regulatory protein PII